VSESFFLYRAHSKKYLNDSEGVIGNPNLSRVRNPRDMPYEVHKSLQNWFIGKFGVDYRGQTLFCTGDHSIAAGYKKPHNEIVTLMPQEPYSLCYSPTCKDLFGHYQFKWSLAADPVAKLESEIDDLAFVHLKNCGLNEAAASGNEVMIFAEKFNYKIVGV
jgi:hypothetical protein